MKKAAIVVVLILAAIAVWYVMRNKNAANANKNANGTNGQNNSANVPGSATTTIIETIYYPPPTIGGTLVRDRFTGNTVAQTQMQASSGTGTAGTGVANNGLGMQTTWMAL
jgi:hypothetical protein